MRSFSRIQHTDGDQEQRYNSHTTVFHVHFVGPMKLFISYSSKSRPTVTALAEHLELIDHEVWFDRELTRNGGHLWWHDILVHIRACDAFIFALSAEALKSRPCQREHGYAACLGKPIIPIWLTDDVDVRYLPLNIQALQFVDYRQQSIPQLRDLRDTLRNLLLAWVLTLPVCVFLGAATFAAGFYIVLALGLR